MNADATVVLNKTQLTKAVHEEADAGSGGADHFRQGFLGDLRNQRFRIFRVCRNSAINSRSRARRFSLELKS